MNLQTCKQLDRQIGQIDYSKDEGSSIDIVASNGDVDADASTEEAADAPKNKEEMKLQLLHLILNLPQTYALSVSRRPAKHLVTSLALSLLICIVVATKGNLHVDDPSKGWFTKGTTVANRAAQEVAIRSRIGISSRGKEVRSLKEEGEKELEDLYCSGAWYTSSKEMLSPDKINLVTMWKIDDSNEMSMSALDAEALYEMCIVEEHTLRVLSENDLCHKCPVEGAFSTYEKRRRMRSQEEERCIQPYSIVGLARVYISARYGFKTLGTEHILPSLSCERLKRAWTSNVQKMFQDVLLQCTSYMLEEMQLKPATNEEYSLCKDFPIMAAGLVDDQFSHTGRLVYTSSIYATKNDPASVQLMYDAEKEGLFRAPLDNEYSSFENDLYDVGMNAIYATDKQGFYELYLEGRLPIEIAISGVSLMIAVVCVLIHTRSPFLTVMGVVQILLTLPIGYFVYYFICGLKL